MTERAKEGCTAELNGIHCDREPGHAGSHRGYLEQVDEPVFWGNGGADRIKAIRARLAAASAGEWTAYRMTHEDRGDDLTPDELGEYVKNSVARSAAESGSSVFLFISVAKPDGGADVCHVGNGPTSPANADFIQHAKGDIEWLLAELLRCADFTLPADLSAPPTPEGSTR